MKILTPETTKTFSKKEQQYLGLAWSSITHNLGIKKKIKF
jgi:hypothetical protein